MSGDVRTEAGIGGVAIAVSARGVCHTGLVPEKGRAAVLFILWKVSRVQPIVQFATADASRQGQANYEYRFRKYRAASTASIRQIRARLGLYFCHLMRASRRADT